MSSWLFCSQSWHNMYILAQCGQQRYIFWFSLWAFKDHQCVTGGWGVLEVRNLFYGEFFPPPAPQRGLPQIYGWDDDDDYTDDNVSLGVEDCGATNDDVDMTIMLMQDCIANNGNNETDDDVLFQVLLLGLRIAFARSLLMLPSSKWTGQ